MITETQQAMFDLTEERALSRILVGIGTDKNDNYRGIIECTGATKGDLERTERSQYYVPVKGMSEETACAIMLAMATAAFCGSDPVKVREDIISELKGEVKEAPKAKTTKAKAKPKSEPAKEPEQAQAEPTKKAKAPTKKAPAKKPKTIAYSRDNDEHKKQLGVLLNDAKPNWSEDKDSVAKAVEFSKGLVGEPFLDTKGEVLQDVIEAIADMFSVEEDASSAL